MTDMARSAGAAVFRSKFEAFLLASIGEDSNDNGLQLSVLSALARQNVDPWEEAAQGGTLMNTSQPVRRHSFLACLAGVR
jgi:hypothetical protein